VPRFSVGQSQTPNRLIRNALLTVRRRVWMLSIRLSQLVDHPRHLESAHNRTQRNVAAMKARGVILSSARPVPRTLVLLVGDTLDRVMLGDWCRRFNAPLKPWVGFTPKTGRYHPAAGPC
jgi:hypothetical protein